jgi:hypothetical protein
MSHRCYVEVAAAGRRQLGLALGQRFGAVVEGNIGYARAEGGWKRKVAAAAGLLTRAREHFPQYVEELEGYSAGAGVALPDLWAVMLEDELDGLGREKCTTIVTNGGRLVSHNEDWDDDAEDAICVLKKTLPGFTALEIHYYNTPLGGSAITINGRGHVQAINSLDHSDRQPGVPRNVIARWLSETRDVEGDCKRLAGIPRSLGYNHVLVAPGGAVFDLECSATRQMLTRPRLPYAHTNHFLSPELACFEEATAEEGSTFQRHHAACSLMKARMTIEEVMALNGDTSQGRKRSIMNRDTIGRVIVDLDAGVARIWLRREKEAGFVDYPLDFMAPAVAS